MSSSLLNATVLQGHRLHSEQDICVFKTRCTHLGFVLNTYIVYSTCLEARSMLQYRSGENAIIASLYFPYHGQHCSKIATVSSYAGKCAMVIPF